MNTEARSTAQITLVARCTRGKSTLHKHFVFLFRNDGCSVAIKAQSGTPGPACHDGRGRKLPILHAYPGELASPPQLAQPRNQSSAMRGGAGPTAPFASGEPPPAAAEEVEEDSGGEEEELELGLSLGSKKQPAPAPCRILTTRELQPAALSPDSSVSSSSPAAAGATVASNRAKAEEGPTATTSPGMVASGHPQSFGVVGWPPIRTFRMNSLFSQAKDNALEVDTKKTATNESDLQKDKEESEKKGRVAGWVKVNMDGDVIGRKVDLNAHRSYKTLALALELMFTKPSIGRCTSNSTKSLKLLDNASEYELTYEDRDGDWMLVGDVPWEMFVSSVKRLRIMRTSDANGLGPRFQCIHRTAASARGRT